MVKADKRDFHRGYRKHVELYKKLKRNDMSVNDRRLILIYGVECGLKYLLLERWKEQDGESIRDEGKKKVISSHDLEKMIKELGQQGNYHFVGLITQHREVVQVKEYHQLYRYGIRIDSRDEEKEKKMIKEMERIAEWIEERM